MVNDGCWASKENPGEHLTLMWAQTRLQAVLEEASVGPV